MISALMLWLKNSGSVLIAGGSLMFSLWAAAQWVEARHYRGLYERSHLEVMECQLAERKLAGAVRLQNRAVAAAGAAVIHRQAAAKKALQKAKFKARIHLGNAQRIRQSKTSGDDCQVTKKLIDDFVSHRRAK